MQVNLGGCLLMGLFSVLLFLEKSPLLYHAYIWMTTFLWTQIFCNIQFLKAILTGLSSTTSKLKMKLIAISAVAILILELLVRRTILHLFLYQLNWMGLTFCKCLASNQVASFSERRLYTWCFLIVGLLAPVFMFLLIPRRALMALYIWAVCWFLSIFTLMPAEIPDNTHLV